MIDDCWRELGARRTSPPTGANLRPALPLGTYEPTAAQETVDRICAMLQNMGSAGWAAFPSGTTLELRADGQESGKDTPQGDMLDRADKRCDLLVLGQTLTTDTGGMGPGGGRVWPLQESP